MIFLPLFPLFLEKGNLLSPSPAKCLGVDDKPFFLPSQPGVMAGNTRFPTWGIWVPFFFMSVCNILQATGLTSAMSTTYQTTTAKTINKR